MDLVADVHRIVVLRAGGVGDLVFTLPALAALRSAYPHAEITLIGDWWHPEFFEGRPGEVDRCFASPVCHGVRGPGRGKREDSDELETFWSRMRQERFDLGLQLHGGGRHSNPFVERLGARVTAGTRTPDAPPLDRWIRYVYHHSEVLRWLEVAGLVGAPTVGLEPRLRLRERDIAEADGVLGQGEGSLAVLNPGAGDPRRRWPTASLAAVGDALAGAGARVVITGARGTDVSLARDVEARMRKPARSVAGELSLGGLAGVLAQAAVVVSNDSGPLHLAGAVAAPTVGIYWAGNLINAGPPTAHRHRCVLSWQQTCPVCGTNAVQEWCDHPVSFVAEVSPDEVIGEALDLFLDAVHRAPAP